MNERLGVAGTVSGIDMRNIAIAITLSLSLAMPAFAETRFAPMNFISLPKLRAWTGDFDGMRERRAIRILVPYSKTLFFIDRGQQLGVEAMLGEQLEGWINNKYKSKSRHINIWFVPVPRDQLLTALRDGRGDIAAGNLTITPESLSMVDFAEPWRSKFDDIVVTGPATEPIGSLEDLAGREVFVRMTGSVAEHVRTINEVFLAKGLRRINFRAADGNLEDEDILEMVNAGLIPLAVVDDYTATLWASVFGSLRPRHDLVVSTDGSMAWAIRKDSPQLKSELSAFILQHPVLTSFGDEIRKRYGADGQIVRNIYNDLDARKFRDLIELFKSQGKKYHFDWRMLVAQAYQESRLDQTRKSPRGAVGVMQVMPATAASKPFGFTGVDKDVATNIEAGAAILRYLIDVCVGPDAAVDERNRMLFGFVAYNAGQGNLRRFRELARRQGLNPNVWFSNVEIAAGQIAGIETVQYVDNIYKYYIAYSLLSERAAASRAARGHPNERDAEEAIKP